jgi:hypothetical protein
MDFTNCIILFIFIYIISIGINNILEYIDTIHEIEKNEFKNELVVAIKEVLTNILKPEDKAT